MYFFLLKLLVYAARTKMIATSMLFVQIQALDNIPALVFKVTQEMGRTAKVCVHPKFKTEIARSHSFLIIFG